MFRPRKPGGASGRGFKKHAAGMWSLCTSICSGNCVRQCSSRWVSSIKERTFVSDSPILGRWSFLSTGVTGAPERDHWGWTRQSAQMCSVDDGGHDHRPWHGANNLGPYPECGHDWARPWSGEEKSPNWL
jgi:hypothetical protein